VEPFNYPMGSHTTVCTADWFCRKCESQIDLSSINLECIWADIYLGAGAMITSLKAFDIDGMTTRET
jgi:hypothetical protein